MAHLLLIMIILLMNTYDDIWFIFLVTGSISYDKFLNL